MRLPTIRNERDVAKAVNDLGFLPFFRSAVPGFSIEEHIAPEFWFPEEGEGVWEWKGPVIQLSGCAYGKFFQNKAVFVSREWFPHLANYRRDGYDFDARYDDGLATYKEKRVYDTLAEAGSMRGKELKRASGFVGEYIKGFDGVLTRLQSRCYIITADFEYAVDRYGKPYGWGLARYTTPEEHFGPAFGETVYQCSPQESKEKLWNHLVSILPEATEEQLKKLLG